MKRPFLERLFIVLWCLWGLLGFFTLFVVGQDSGPIGKNLFPLVLALGLPSIFLTLLQYLVLGFFNPFRLLKATEPPA
jgi:hypothetical protein